MSVGEVLVVVGVEVIDVMVVVRYVLDDFEDVLSGVVGFSGFYSVGQVLFGFLLCDFIVQCDVLIVWLIDEDVVQSEFFVFIVSYDFVLVYWMEYFEFWLMQGICSFMFVCEFLDVVVFMVYLFVMCVCFIFDDVVGEKWVMSCVGYFFDDVLCVVFVVVNCLIDVFYCINDYGVVFVVVVVGGVLGMFLWFIFCSIDDCDIVCILLEGVSMYCMIDVFVCLENLCCCLVCVVVEVFWWVMMCLSDESF